MSADSAAALAAWQKREQEFFEGKKRELSSDSGYPCAGRLLYHARENFGDNTALIQDSVTLTYNQWYDRSLIVSAYLHELGVKPGDRVILYAENSLFFCVIYCAIWHLGAVVVPVNTFLHEHELAHILADAQPRLVVTQDQFLQQLEKLSGGTVLVVPEAILPSDRDTADMQQAESYRYDCNQDELVLLLYTSGTTGVPKGVMLSSKNVVANTLQSYARFCSCNNLSSDERFFCVLPLFHAFSQNACLWLPMVLGASIIIVSKIDRRLILKGLERKPTFFFGFPALYGLLCLMKTAPLEHVKMFVSGADMLPDKIRAVFAMLYGRKICSGYGLTEASPVVAVDEQNAECATYVVGHPLVGIECQIRDDQGASLQVGEVGTLWLRGDNIMLGYYHSEEQTKEVLRDGWLCTGDLAYLSQDGMVAICGRSKDLIIHKGFNIYPQEIENVLMRHASVVKVAVIGKSDEHSGQIPVAFIAAGGDSHTIVADLHKLCADNLAAYKIPRKFICLDDLPMSPTGKVDKKLLVEQYAL